MTALRCATVLSFVVVSVLCAPIHAHALEVERGSAVTTVTVQRGDRASSTSPNTPREYSGVAGADSSAWPLIEVSPDLFDGGWFACGRCGPAIGTKELVIRLERPAIIAVSDAGRLASPTVGMRIRVESASPGVIVRGALYVRFDDGDVVRSDRVAVVGRNVDVVADGSNEIELSDVSLRDFQLRTGGGNDDVDAARARVDDDLATYFDRNGGRSSALVSLGSGNDRITAPEQLGDALALGPGDDVAAFRGPHANEFQVTTDGGRDVIEAADLTSRLDVYARAQRRLQITSAASALTVRSFADELDIDARRSRYTSIGGNVRSAVVRTGPGRDDVELNGGQAVVDLGAGADELLTASSRVRGTLGSGNDSLHLRPPGFSRGVRRPAGSVAGVACGPGVDVVTIRAATAGECERRAPSSPFDHFPDLHYLDRGTRDWYWTRKGRALPSLFDYGSAGSSVPVVEHAPAKVVLRPGPDANVLKLKTVNLDGVASWSCTGCPTLPAGAEVQLQLQHQVRVDVRGLRGSALPPLLTLSPVGARGSRSHVLTRWLEPVRLRAAGNELLSEGRPVLRIDGRVPWIGVQTSDGRDIVDLSDADPWFEWTVSSGRGRDTIVGSRWMDGIFAAGRAVIRSGAGNDRIRGGRGSLIDAGAGDDEVEMREPGRILAGTGNDEVRTTGGSLLIDGGPGNDDLFAKYGTDVVVGGGGHDWIRKAGGRLTASGGRGNDLLHTDPGVRGTFACGPGVDGAFEASTTRATGDRTCEHGADFWNPSAPWAQFFNAGSTTLTIDDRHNVPDEPH